MLVHVQYSINENEHVLYRVVQVWPI